MDRSVNNERLRAAVQARRDKSGAIPSAEVTALTVELIGLVDELVEAALGEGYHAATIVRPDQ